jgi:hypothetical protein
LVVQVLWLEEPLEPSLRQQAHLLLEAESLEALQRQVLALAQVLAQPQEQVPPPPQQGLF